MTNHALLNVVTNYYNSLW